MESATETLNKSTYLILIIVIRLTRKTHAYDGNNKSSYPQKIKRRYSTVENRA